MPRRNKRIEEPNNKTIRRQDLSRSWTGNLLRELDKKSKKNDSRPNNSKNKKSQKRNS